MQVIVLLGPPAAGKGTQAQFLEDQGFFIFSASACLKERAAKGDALGNLLAQKMAAGEIAVEADAVLMEGIEAKINELQGEGKKGIVLDGTPRTVDQARQLQEFLANKGLGLKVIQLVVGQDILNERRKKRQSDDLAAGRTPRKDDAEEVFLRRMAVYREKTVPVINFYAQNGALCPIDASKSPAEVNRQVGVILGLGDRKMGPRPPTP